MTPQAPVRRRPEPDPVGAGQESVWSYPRPPRLEATDRSVRVATGSTTLAETTEALRLLETSHPPGFYLPAEDCDLSCFVACHATTFCEWKGRAVYFDVVLPDLVIEAGAWSYPDPSPAYRALANHLAFYPSLFDCFVDEEPVTPQPGRFYGGWVTGDVVGPFKGEPGTEFW